MFLLFLFAEITFGADYTILRVEPDQIISSGQVEVSIFVDPKYDGECFLKFDSTVVKCSASNGKIVCEAPPHEPGKYNVYFSVDAEKWSDGFSVLYVISSKAVKIAVIALIGTCAASMLLFYWQMRQCKKSQKKNRRNQAAAYGRNMGFDDDGDDDDFQPLNRSNYP